MDESDPNLARSSAKQNFEQLVALFPSALRAREEGLLGEIKALKGSAIKKLRHLHKVSGLIAEGVAPFIACARGCSACCHYNVHLLPIEAELIEKHSGAKRSRGLHTQQDFTGTPCPFLCDGQCSIYEVRPMSCRRHVAFTKTAYWCAPDRCSDIELPQLRFSEVDAAFEHIVQEDGRYDISDIRQQFLTP